MSQMQDGEVETWLRELINLEFEIQQQITELKDSVTSIKLLQSANVKIKDQLKVLHKRLQVS
jgi:hypothetical protein